MNLEPSRILIGLERQAYEVVIGEGSLKGLGKEILKTGAKEGSKVLIVTNPDVGRPYGDICLESLIKVGFEPTLLVLEAGEDKKTPDSIGLIHDAAYKAKLERSSIMVALGGGVVGDMTGFAAATWLRGIPVVQVPTTLLSMVDASIGGKTGVNHPGGKNLIGAFHQPQLVLIDPTTLSSLPEREFRAGLAEVIKYGVICDLPLFNFLYDLKEISTPSKIHLKALHDILHRSAATKAKIVASDEKESGIRAILNYGHTFGHVVEKLCGYGTWLHGEAVAIGMVAVGELAVQIKSWSREDAERQKTLIQKANLPTEWPKLNSEEVFRALQGDKKVKDGKIRFVIPTTIGRVHINNDITKEEIESCLTRLM